MASNKKLEYTYDKEHTTETLTAMCRNEVKNFTSGTIANVLLGRIILQDRYKAELEAGKELQSLIFQFAKEFISPEITVRDVYTKMERGRANFYGLNRKLIGQINFFAMKEQPSLMAKFLKEFPQQLDSIRKNWDAAAVPKQPKASKLAGEIDAEPAE
jgi:hypothetical protein